MADETPLEIVEYYRNLLIMQYAGGPKAAGTIGATVAPIIIPQTSVQEVSFSLVPTSGSFVLSWDDIASASIAWNDSSATIQTKLRAITGLSSVVVTGEISDGSFSVTFTNVSAPAALLVVNSSTLQASAVDVSITIAETDVTLPIAVVNGFNLVGDEIAVGAQLDVLGKYVGVSRTGPGFVSVITLDDAQYLTLIQMAIIKNAAGSSLSVIQDFVYQFFPGQMFVYDFANMTMNYIISQAIGSQELMQLFITEGLLPKPMAVLIQLYYPPSANLFSFRTYQHEAYNGEPFNNYADYQEDWPWLSYHHLVTP